MITLSGSELELESENKNVKFEWANQGQPGPTYARDYKGPYKSHYKGRTPLYWCRRKRSGPKRVIQPHYIQNENPALPAQGDIS